LGQSILSKGCKEVIVQEEREGEVVRRALNRWENVERWRTGSLGRRDTVHVE
jgi:hypothetical protein